MHTARHKELPLYSSPTGNTPSNCTPSNVQLQTTARYLHPKNRKYFPRIYFRNEREIPNT